MPLAIPMRGRMVHEHDGAAELQLYGVRPEEVIYSVSRADLNRVLDRGRRRIPERRVSLRAAVRWAWRTSATCSSCATRPADASITALAQPTIATDGAGSAVRDALVAREVATVREEPLDHDYKELTIPARDGKHALDPNALHIWPRGGFMLIALPNPDGTFTATLFLARHGANSFDELRNPGAVDAFFAREFPSARALMPDLTREFFEHPQGPLGTVYTRGWHLNGEVLLLGDAAHAIVPFHGQGMNCAFEDCVRADPDDGRASQLGGIVRGVRARAAAEHRCHRADGAGELRRDARGGAGSGVPRGRRRKRKNWKGGIRISFRGIRQVMFHPEIPYREIPARGAS